MEDLLKPRIKVIADFWDNPFKVGDVICFEFYKDYYDFMTDKVVGQDWYTDFLPLDRKDVTRTQYALRGFTPYPHLFRKMDWWEDRKPEEMPEYVRYGEFDKNYHIYKVTLYNLQENEAWENDYQLPFRNFSFYPATLSEYLNQNKK